MNGTGAPLEEPDLKSAIFSYCFEPVTRTVNAVTDHSRQQWKFDGATKLHAAQSPFLVVVVTSEVVNASSQEKI